MSRWRSIHAKQCIPDHQRLRHHRERRHSRRGRWNLVTPNWPGKLILVIRLAQKQKGIGMNLLFCSANPFRDLDIISELEAVLSHLDSLVWHIDYLPDLSLDKLTEKIRTFQPDIVHFCGHSDANSLMFVSSTNGKPQSIPPRMFGAILLEGKVLKAVILNSCSSLGVFTDLRDTADWGIATTRRVTDAECTEFTRVFYMRLSANGIDIRGAYTYAIDSLYHKNNDLKEAESTKRQISGGRSLRDLLPSISRAGTEPVKFHITKLEPTWRRVRRLKAILFLILSGWLFSFALVLPGAVALNQRKTNELNAMRLTLNQIEREREQQTAQLAKSQALLAQLQYNYGYGFYGHFTSSNAVISH